MHWARAGGSQSETTARRIDIAILLPERQLCRRTQKNHRVVTIGFMLPDHTVEYIIQEPFGG